MKFLLILMLLLVPSATFACGPSVFDSLDRNTWLIAFGLLVSLAVNCILLIVMRLLPSNKNLTITAVLFKVWKAMVYIVLACLFVAISTIVTVELLQNTTCLGNEDITDLIPEGTYPDRKF